MSSPPPWPPAPPEERPQDRAHVSRTCAAAQQPAEQVTQAACPHGAGLFSLVIERIHVIIRIHQYLL